MSSSGNKAVFDEDFLQTDTNYTIDVFVNENIEDSISFELALLNVDGSLTDSHDFTYQIMQEGRDYSISFSLARKAALLQQEQPLTIFLKSSALKLEKKFAVKVWDLPKTSELNLPQLVGLTNDSTIEALGSKGGVYFYWLNLPVWQPPAQVTWRENPFDNVSWQLFYHSLAWLNSYAELYNRTQDESYLTAIDSYLSQYNDITNDPLNTPIAASYKEDAVSLRASNLAYLYLTFYIQKSEEKRIVIEDLLRKDILMLQKYLEETKWDNKNHGAIQARAALNIIATLPLNEEASNLLNSVNRRLTALSQLLFSTQGYVIEQATEYHFVSLSMMLEAQQQLRTFNMPINIELNQKIEKALIVAPYLLYQDGTTPAIGDSSYDKKWRGYVSRFYQEFGEPIPELDNYFLNGQSSLNDLLVLEEEGLIVAKHISDTQEQSKVFFDIGKSPIIHGHYDNLNILAELSGEKLLVDSGGPYTYAKNDREHFWKASAHNLIVINGEEKPDKTAEIISYNENEDQISALGSMLLSDDIIHKRAFILAKDSQPVLIVLDQLNNLQQSDEVDEYWHYSPTFTIEKIDHNLTKLNSSSERAYYHYRLVNNDESCTYIAGDLDNNQPFLGWVSPTYNNVIPATVQHCNSVGDSTLRVNVFTSNKLQSLPIYTVKGNEVIINLDGRSISYIEF